MSFNQEYQRDVDANKINLQYGVPGQQAGWSAMAKVVRDFDEEKVRDCKEDIDTLLVFAGLFSAVLSAFLVATYPNLQPSPTNTMIYTLERIASQTASYNLANGQLVATNVLPASPPVFEAAVEDIRVNVLWFASLVVSLMTASFGMLVKQWLREFLAAEVPSPQARLRIRHFREPEINRWKVYEIAASLPLLLQLSLGLFFVGLCYFTASVHASVGYTTLPLVVAWALFFFSATTLPLFFPRCPYKTTLLKAAIAHVHRSISRASENAWRHLHRPLNHTATYGWLDWVRSLLQKLLSPMKSITDETALVEDADQDLDILVSVDAIQTNDEILATTIAEAFHYIQPDWTDAVLFTMRILSHRLEVVPPSNRVLPQWPFRDPLPLQPLRPQATEGVFSILNSYVGKIDWSYESVFLTDRPFGRRYYGDFTFLSAFAMLLSGAASSVDRAPPETMLFLKASITSRLHGPVLCRDMLYLSAWSNDWTDGQKWKSRRDSITRVLAALTEVASPMQLDVRTGIRCFERIMLSLPQSDSELGGTLSSEPTRDATQIEWSTWVLPWTSDLLLRHRTLSYLLIFVSIEFRRILSSPDPDVLPASGTTSILTAVVRHIPVLNGSYYDKQIYRGIWDLVALALENRSCTSGLVKALLYGGSDASRRNLLLSLGGLMDHLKLRHQSRHASNANFDNLAAVITDEFFGDEMDLTRALELCHIAILILYAVPQSSKRSETWEELFLKFDKSLRSLSIVETANRAIPEAHSGHSREVRELADACIACLDAFEHRLFSRLAPVEPHPYDDDPQIQNSQRGFVLPTGLVHTLHELAGRSAREGRQGIQIQTT